VFAGFGWIAAGSILVGIMNFFDVMNGVSRD